MGKINQSGAVIGYPNGQDGCVIGRPVVLHANVSANIFEASKRTLVIFRLQSTLTLPGEVYQTSLWEV